MRRVQITPDLLAGLAFSLFGAGFLIASLHYEYGSAQQMGPGYFPRILSGSLLILGVFQIYQSIRSAGPEEVGWRLFSAKPLIFVLGGMAAFAATLETLGIVLASLILVLTAGIVAPEGRWKELLVASVILATFSALVFVKALGVYMPIWPEGF
jgi:hypothetical protein